MYLPQKFLIPWAGAPDINCLKRDVAIKFLYFTSTHGSWLNQAELEIWVLKNQCLNGCRYPDEGILRRKVQAWAFERNNQKIGINWIFTRKQAEIKFNIKNNPV